MDMLILFLKSLGFLAAFVTGAFFLIIGAILVFELAEIAGEKVIDGIACCINWITGYGFTCKDV